MENFGQQEQIVQTEQSISEQQTSTEADPTNYNSAVNTQQQAEVDPFDAFIEKGGVDFINQPMLPQYQQQQPQYQQQHYPQQPVYQQPQYQQPVQYQQQLSQQQQQQLNQMNQTERQTVQQAIEIGIDKDKAFDLINEDPVQFANLILQKTQEITSKNAVNPQVIMQQVTQQVMQGVNQQLLAKEQQQFVSEVKSIATPLFQKEGIHVNPYIEQSLTQMAIAPAQVNGMVVYNEHGQTVSRVDYAYNNYLSHARLGQLQGKVLTEQEFTAKFILNDYKKYISKASNSPQSQANGQIRQTVNQVRTPGQPVVANKSYMDAVKSVKSEAELDALVKSIK